MRIFGFPRPSSEIQEHDSLYHRWIGPMVGIAAIAFSILIGLLLAWKLWVNVNALVKFIFPFVK